jgi:hypothetical protein
VLRDGKGHDEICDDRTGQRMVVAVIDHLVGS